MVAKGEIEMAITKFGRKFLGELKSAGYLFLALAIVVVVLKFLGIPLDKLVPFVH